VPAPVRLTQRRTDRPMHLMRGPRPSTRLDHLPVQALKMLRLQSLQTVLAQSGD
jgi:hypothetical protein